MYLHNKSIRISGPNIIIKKKNEYKGDELFFLEYKGDELVELWRWLWRGYKKKKKRLDKRKERRLVKLVRHYRKRKLM